MSERSFIIISTTRFNTTRLNNATPFSHPFYLLAGLASAIDLLMGLEKQCRVGNDLTTLKRVVLHSVQLCKKCGDYEKLIDTLNFIVKRRSQKNAAITEIVKEAIGYVDEAPDEDIKIKLVICLRDITDGRIYVEVSKGICASVAKRMKTLCRGANDAASLPERSEHKGL